MPLRDVIERVREREKTLTVYAPDDRLVPSIRDYFTSQNLSVDYVPIPESEPGHVVLSEHDRFRESLPLAALEPLVDPAHDQHPRRVGDDPPYKPLLEHVDGATFTAYDRRQMLHASREVEDRAWRCGEGRLAAGFQTAEQFTDQRDAYRLLGDVLDVHVYADGTADTPDGVDLHALDGDATDLWFVAYDGGGDETQKSALLAEERGDGEFYGVLTYEPALVDAAFAELEVPSRATS